MFYKLNLRKRISVKLLDGGTRYGQTLSQLAHNVEQPSAHQRNAIQMFQMLHSKKEERKAGEGVGVRLESPIETRSIFVVFIFFACVVVVFVRFGGGG